jgi:hypothetical protein
VEAERWASKIVYTYHEVTLDKLQLVGKTLFLSISSCSLNLVVIVVQSSDMSACELCNLSSWSSYTTPNIKHFVAIRDTDLCSKIMFVTGNGLVEWLAVCKAAEME